MTTEKPTSASRFAAAFERDFRQNTPRAAGNGEITLFMALRHTLLAQSKKFDVEVIHGFRHQVCFRHSLCTWRRPHPARCELADLMIVTYDEDSEEVRLCFLQAKSERDESLVYEHTYAANLEQWLLLAKRPAITGVGKFSPPRTLLKDASHASIGAFGFFHRPSAGHCELHYRAASELRVVSQYSQRYGRLETDAYHLGGHLRPDECLAADSVRDFAHALYLVRIGTPVGRMDVSIRRWLAGVLLWTSAERRTVGPSAANVLRRL